MGICPRSICLDDGIFCEFKHVLFLTRSVQSQRRSYSGLFCSHLYIDTVCQSIVQQEVLLTGRRIELIRYTSIPSIQLAILLCHGKCDILFPVSSFLSVYVYVLRANFQPVFITILQTFGTVSTLLAV